MDYRTVHGKDADDLARQLGEWSKLGWKVVSIVKESRGYRAFIEGTNPQVPEPPTEPMSELDELTASEIEKAARPEWDETND